MSQKTGVCPFCLEEWPLWQARRLKIFVAALNTVRLYIICPLCGCRFGAADVDKLVKTLCRFC